MLHHEQFIDLLAGLVESIPIQKALSERGLAFAWSSFPDVAKRNLTATQLAYACTQRAVDPDPNLRIAIHIQILSYLYPLRDGMPNLDAGLRRDLPDRMRTPHIFHPLNADQSQRPPVLPPAPTEPPAWLSESLAARRRRLEALAKQTGTPLTGS